MSVDVGQNFGPPGWQPSPLLTISSCHITRGENANCGKE